SASGWNLGGNGNSGIISPRWIEGPLETSGRRRVFEPGREWRQGVRFRRGLDQAHGQGTTALLRGKDRKGSVGFRLRRKVRRLGLRARARRRTHRDSNLGWRPHLHRRREWSDALPGRQNQCRHLGEKYRQGISGGGNVMPAVAVARRRGVAG